MCIPKVLITGLLALMAGACAFGSGVPGDVSYASGYTITPVAVAPSSSTDTDKEYRHYYSLFHIGNVFYYDSTTFDIDLVVAPNSTQLVGL